LAEQLVIAVCGISSVFLSQCHHRNQRRWACVFGIVAQPFWIYATWQAQQWGIFLLAFFYATAWIKGFWLYWVKKEGG
jgi:hypothetical protein